MSWTAGVTQLRNLLSDGDKEKLRYRKRCIGQIDGTNLIFKTFEFRRVTDFGASNAPEGVYVSGTLVDIDEDFPDLGEFTLLTAPVDGDVVEATYYIQWFLDTELTDFLNDATQWLGLGDDFTVVPIGLQHAAKFYAAKLACEKLSLRWAEYISETYMMQDAPKTNDRSPVEKFIALAKNYFEQASLARKNYYQRNDEAEAPLFANAVGRISDVAPKR
jgi:hypothetical protein